jgi:hypothetical protein
MAIYNASFYLGTSKAAGLRGQVIDASIFNARYDV